MNGDKAQMLTEFRALVPDAEMLSAVLGEGAWQGHHRCSGYVLPLSNGSLAVKQMLNGTVAL